jgi:hypothetical protein
MSITKVRPLGWAYNKKVSSAEFQQLDENASYGLDKRAGETDTLESDITVASGASIILDFGAELRANTGGVVIDPGGVLVVESASLTTIDLGASSSLNTIGGTIDVDATSIFDIASGAVCTWTLGNGSVLNMTGASSSINLLSTSTLNTTSNGQIVLGGGSNDWVTFSSSRSRTIRFGFNYELAGYATTGWKSDASSTPRLISTAVADEMVIQIPLHDGATLTSIKVFHEIDSSHLPATKFNAEVFRIYSSGTAPSSLCSGGPTYSDGANATDYYDSGNIKTMTITCDQNNVLDRSSVAAFVVNIKEESGASSVAGNLVYGFEATYTSISNTKFA